MGKPQDASRRAKDTGKHKRTPEAEETLIRVLRETGRKDLAARAVGISTSTAWLWWKEGDLKERAEAALAEYWQLHPFEQVPEPPSLPVERTAAPGEDWTRYQRDPVGFFRNVLGWEPWAKQVEIAHALAEALADEGPLPQGGDEESSPDLLAPRLPAEGLKPSAPPLRRIAVRSANGVGKTALAARLMLWVARCWPDSIVVTTAPTARQVDELLWRQARAAHQESKVRLGGQFLRSTSRWDLGPNWYAIGVSPEAGTVEKFQGFHAETLVFIVDEASGVPETHWEAIKGSALAGRSVVLAIGNPTRLSGEFYDAFHSRADLWRRLSISAFDTPNLHREGGNLRGGGESNSVAAGPGPEQKEAPLSVSASLPVSPIPGLVTPQAVEDARADWGEDSALWHVRVLGQFPAAGTHSLISLSWLEDMDRVKRVDGPWALGVDVARSGMDQTVLALMRGNALVHLEAWQGQDTMRTAGRVKMFWDALRWVEPGTMRPKRVRTPEEEARINAMRLEAEDEHYEYWRRNAPSSYGPFKLTAVKPPKFVWRDPDEPEPPASHRVTIAIDDGGVGGGVVDRLREQDVPVHAVTFGAAAEKRHEGSGKFRNRVSELYWTLREELREGRLYFGATVTPSRPEEGTEGMVLAVRPEMKAKLWAQLMQIEWEVESDRAVRVHKRGLDGHGRSPDVADAVALVVEAKNRDRISGRSRVQIFL